MYQISCYNELSIIIIIKTYLITVKSTVKIFKAKILISLFSAISTDQIIEQVLMKSLKSRGGMTGPGKGLNVEASRNQWIHSRPICAAVSRLVFINNI